MARPPRNRNRAVRHWVRTLARDQRAATAIEYGLIVALITIAMITALAGVADVTTNMWNHVSSKVQNAH